MDNFKEIFGKRIRQLREVTCTTQMDLAQHLGMTSTGAVSQIEMGAKGMKMENIIKTAEFFGVPVAILTDRRNFSKLDLRICLAVTDIVKNKDKRKKEYRQLKSFL